MAELSPRAPPCRQAGRREGTIFHLLLVIREKGIKRWEILSDSAVKMILPDIEHFFRFGECFASK
jgi:hypothetical protein